MKIIRDEAIRIAKLAGQKIKELRENEQYHESIKNGYELVTTADLMSNELIKTEIAKNFPNDQLLSEEESDHNHPASLLNPTWIVDPIDGTVGYVNNHYQVCVSIAYAVDNKVRVGVVYNPFLDELFYAVDGEGAFLNHTSIRVNNTYDLSQSVIGTGFPHKRDDLSEPLALLAAILPKIRDVRRLGSPALDICWVASSRMQGFYEGQLHPWDGAAARLIAQEAGANTSHFGKPLPSNSVRSCINGDHVIVSGPKIFEELKLLLNQAIQQS